MAPDFDRNERFRNLVERDEILVLPGCYDALTAKLVAKTDFDAAYVSGAGVSNTKLGIADMGYVTLTEMRQRLEYIADAVDIPLLSDADTGYGNPLHVRRTVQAYEDEGVSALHLEDQSFPKKCGHFDDKSVVPLEEFLPKIRAAVEARRDPNFTVIARTDVRAVDGVDAAIERGNAFAEAGADVVFPEAPQSREEMERFCEEIDAPVMANMVEYGKTPLLPAAELDELGYDLVIFPNSLMRTGMLAMKETAEHLRETGTTADIESKIASFDLRNALTDKDEVEALSEKYAR